MHGGGDPAAAGYRLGAGGQDRYGPVLRRGVWWVEVAVRVLAQEGAATCCYRAVVMFVGVWALMRGAEECMHRKCSGLGLTNGRNERTRKR